MKLKEYIEERGKDEKDTIFLIGASSSFFFIGTAEEFKKDAYKIDAGFIRNAQRLISKRTPKKVWRAHIYKTDSDPSSWQTYIDTYVPVGEREVLEVYPRLQRDGVVVSVEGTEAGKFWFKEEYDEAFGEY